MKKSLTALLVLTISLSFIFIGLVSGEIRINEIELNPEGEDSGNEWIELYSNEIINITNWEIRNSNGKSMTFNKSLSEYALINTSTNLLTNDNNKLSLYDNNSVLIFETINLTDSKNNNLSFQYCSGSWLERISTQGIENNCSSDSPEPDPESEEEEPTIYVELIWDEDEIISGEEFSVEVFAYNLKDENYDLKVWIEFEDNDTIISDRYDEEDEGWKSGTYYIYDFFEGNGNKSGEITLRIRDDYLDYYGDAKIFAKLDVGSTFEEDIEILRKEEEEKYEPVTYFQNTVKQETSSITGEVIQLGKKIEPKTEDIKSQEIIYESRLGLVKRYSVYGFALLCVILCVLLVFNKFK